MSNQKKKTIIRPLWIEVDLKALKGNYKAIHDFLGKKVKVIATIKQEAYGHGLRAVARALRASGVDFFGVGSVEEAIELRDDGFKGSILVLSSVLSQYSQYFIKYDITPTIVDLKFAKSLNEHAALKRKKIPVHVKIDTGMGRLGLYYKDGEKFITSLSRLSNLYLEGIYTHFPAADSDVDFTRYQIDAFNGFIKKLSDRNINFKYCHCANSIAAVRHSNAHFNMVRPGLILYGIGPYDKSKIIVTPALSLKSKVIFVKKVVKGMGVSYGRTYVAKSPRDIATISVGYADGYPWALSNKAKVIINNNFYQVAGRVCMDHTMADIDTDKRVKIGDEVILIGKSKDKNISVEEIARLAETIPYEIVSRLSLKIPRIYKD
jgi:alanine racemase